MLSIVIKFRLIMLMCSSEMKMYSTRRSVVVIPEQGEDRQGIELEFESTRVDLIIKVGFPVWQNAAVSSFNYVRDDKISAPFCGDVWNC